MKISLVKSRTDTAPLAVELTWPELATSLATSRALTWDRKSYLELSLSNRGRAKDGPAWLPGSCSAGERKDVSMGAIHCVVLDFDEMSALDEDELWASLSEWNCIAHTTASHGLDSPKWRAVFPLSRAVEASAWKPFWLGFVKQLGFRGKLTPDGAAKNASRLFYLPAHLSDVTPGFRVFNGATIRTEEIRVAPKPAPRRAPLVKWEPSDAAMQYAKAALRKIGPAVEGNMGDAKTFRVCCLVLRDFDFDRARGMELLRWWNAGNCPPWTDAELEQKADNAIAHGTSEFGCRRPFQLSRNAWDRNAILAYLGSKS